MSARRARTRTAAVAALVWLALVAPARAGEESAGTRAAGFLTAGAGPAVLARGGAGLALGGDLQSAAINPASLASLSGRRFAFAHAALEDGAVQEWAAWGGRVGATRVGLTALVRNEGSLDARDENGLPAGAMSLSSTAVGLQLARPLVRWLEVGGTVRGVGERIGGDVGLGLSFDAGALVHAGLLHVALAGQNFGGGMNWGGRRWRMPASLGGGVALDHAPSGLRVALDLNAPADYYRSVRAGAEWRWRDRLALRGGWRQELGAPADERLGGPAFGVGAGAGALWIDYGYVLGGAGEVTHRIGLELRRFGASSASAPATVAPAPAPGRE